MTPLLPPPLVGKVHCMDALELMRLISAESVDAIITDLPYGTTACSWDEIIPFAPMWASVKRVLKPRGVFVTTASQPFTSKLVMSNLDWFREELIWDKCGPVDHLNVHKRHMKQHETVIVFGQNWDSYYPVFGSVGKPFGKVKGSGKSVYGAAGDNKQQSVGYPKSILRFPRPNNLSGGGLHPTQKPVALYEYLIRTYTQPGELVLDFCSGSGTTGVAARNLKRNYILGDTSAEYCEIARERLKTEFASRKLGGTSELDDMPLFRGDKLFEPAGKLKEAR